ncbi:hypothetical protein FRZ44_46930 [Hypericibacter terrae]|uniref:Uncharacterized protein n=1 Tax=Hypericibacter terrae TaxID=2602015 RepID=A0A5J6MTN0_9PROT|nr:hypothetical protein FRZ44_46930 [Hypericibacter terrae]
MPSDLGCSDRDAMNDGAGMSPGADTTLDPVARKTAPRPFPAAFDPGAASLWLAGWLIPLA